MSNPWESRPRLLQRSEFSRLDHLGWSLLSTTPRTGIRTTRTKVRVIPPEVRVTRTGIRVILTKVRKTSPRAEPSGPKSG